MAGGLYYEHTCSLDTDLCTVTHLRVLSEKFVHSLFFLGSFVLWGDDLCNRDLYYHRYVRTLDTTFGSKTSNIKQKNAAKPVFQTHQVSQTSQHRGQQR